jgi:acylphosphatase
MTRRVRFRIAGMVQGVGFRFSTRHEAARLGLVGYVRNLPSGEVEGEAEGPTERVDRFLAWCRLGPGGSRVDRCHVDELPVRGDEPRFEIRH